MTGQEKSFFDELCAFRIKKISIKSYTGCNQFNLIRLEFWLIKLYNKCYVFYFILFKLNSMISLSYAHLAGFFTRYNSLESFSLSQNLANFSAPVSNYFESLFVIFKWLSWLLNNVQKNVCRHKVAYQIASQRNLLILN